VSRRDLDTVLEYHERTKHRFERYARGPGGLDWATQPDPFRTFAGAARIELPLLENSLASRYTDLYRPGRITPAPLRLENMATLFELSFGLSAWKQYGDDRWALRCNPSSGNLHPTEAYLVTTGLRDLADGVYHYVSLDHVLECRCEFEAVPEGDTSSPACETVLIGLSSIHWREAWKYGERAYRYCQHDAGHAMAAVRYAAAVLGWKAELLIEWADADIAALLGLDRSEDFGPAEREHPDLILRLTKGRAVTAADISIAQLVDAAHGGRWQGNANRLSDHHRHHWPVIDEVCAACAKPRTAESAWTIPPLPDTLEVECVAHASDIIKQRRSAQAFDGSTGIYSSAFFRMLDMTLPRDGVPPWDAVPWRPRLHLLLFVHRVEGLPEGLYLFLRNPDAEEPLRDELTSELEWATVDGCPSHFKLFRLARARAERAARTLSCHQDIASDSAFSLGMLAEYASSLESGPWVYRQLHWEAGMIGQVLYLEAEAAGLRGTGIGCFFDDGVHELLGLQSRVFQSLYHFTIGGATIDTRLQTLPAYAHLQRRSEI